MGRDYTVASSSLALILSLALLDHVAVVGDSLSYGWPDRWKRKGEVLVVNLAVPGSSARAWEEQDLSIWIRDHPGPNVVDFTLVWLGAIDAAIFGRSAGEIRESLHRVTANARAAGSDRVIWIFGPSYGIAALDELAEVCPGDCLDLRKLGERPELFRDGVHWNARGERVVLRRIRAYLRSINFPQR